MSDANSKGNLFDEMPLLNYCDEFLKPHTAFLETCKVIAHQHGMKETLLMMQKLISLGVKPENVYFLAKPYSENYETIQAAKGIGINVYRIEQTIPLGYYYESLEKAICRIWSDATKTPAKGSYICIDDGGNLLSLAPENLENRGKIIGVEQTTSGAKLIERMSTKAPVVSVAGSFLKRYFEPPFIAEASIRKFNESIASLVKNKTCTIIGYGIIGKALDSFLKAEGYQISTYDRINSTTEEQEKNLLSSIEHSDVIFGCAGEDISPLLLKNKEFLANKVLVSCSSGDIEFRSLLSAQNAKRFNVNDTFSEVHLEGLNTIILNSGYPITFDRKATSVPLKDMQLIRAAMIMAVAQLLDKRTTSNGLVMLSSHSQMHLINKWLSMNPSRHRDYNIMTIEASRNVEMIEGLSNGMR